MTWHLAQVNIARSKAPFDAPAMAALTSQIAEMNALAESSPGFVWRFTAESGGDNRLDLFADYLVPFDRHCLFFNMSVWRSVQDLKRYAFDSAHLHFYRRRNEWMDPVPRAHAAMWWMPEPELPTVAEAKDRLLELDQRGPTAFAFTFAKPFAPPDTFTAEI
jgi:hypothetical protein